MLAAQRSFLFFLPAAHNLIPPPPSILLPDAASYENYPDTFGAEVERKVLVDHFLLAGGPLGGGVPAQVSFTKSCQG